MLGRQIVGGDRVSREFAARMVRVGAARGTGYGRRRLLQSLAAAVVVVALVTATGNRDTTSALFGSASNTTAQLGTQRIFSGERTTTGFVVQDASGGTGSDQSSPLAAAGDGRTTTTKAWGTSFSSSRYLLFDMSAPLPGGLAITSPVFRLAFASAGASTSCVYVDVLTISTNSLQATYGSSSSPAACVTGATPVTAQVALPVVATTDLADNLRIRVWGRDGAGGGMVLDEARVTASTPYVSVSTWPVRVTDASDGVVVSTPWVLQGP